MSSNQDPARLIAERVARRLAGDSSNEPGKSTTRNGAEHADEKPRARVINFISSAPPRPTRPAISPQAESKPQSFAQSLAQNFERPASLVPPTAQSPWLAPFARAAADSTHHQIAEHPSQERFGVEEAAVSELVEFFENEKQCSVDPSGKPCDHCAMCSSRGF
jgi:hypothetical protein